MRARRHHRLNFWLMAGYAALIGVAAVLGWYLKQNIQVAAWVQPVGHLLHDAQTRYDEVREAFRNQQRLVAENAVLKERIVALERMVVARDEAVLENARLQGLLKLTVPGNPWLPAVAPVLGHSPDNWHQRLLIGLSRELTWEAPTTVIGQSGVVGRLAEMSGQTGVVVLLTDPGSSIPVFNARTRATAVMLGQDDEWPSLKYMVEPGKWRVGDRILTSGLSGIDPKGLLVGHVVQLKRAHHSLYPELRVRPAVSLGTLEEVIVLPKGMRALPTPRPTPSPTPVPQATPGAADRQSRET